LAALSGFAAFERGARLLVIALPYAPLPPACGTLPPRGYREDRAEPTAIGELAAEPAANEGGARPKSASGQGLSPCAPVSAISRRWRTAGKVKAPLSKTQPDWRNRGGPVG
jgi:hypothetical protein